MYPTSFDSRWLQGPPEFVMPRIARLMEYGFTCQSLAAVCSPITETISGTQVQNWRDRLYAVLGRPSSFNESWPELPNNWEHNLPGLDR